MTFFMVHLPFKPAWQATHLLWLGHSGGSKADRVKVDFSMGPLLCAMWMFSPDLLTAVRTLRVTSSEMYARLSTPFLAVLLVLSAASLGGSLLRLHNHVGGIIILLQHPCNLLSASAASCCRAGDLQCSVYLRRGYFIFG